jgi:hypothetical protein
MEPRLGQTIYVDLPPLVHPGTGAASDADSTPTVAVYEDATAAAILTPTVVKRSGTTGQYYVAIACTEGNGFESGRSYRAIATATVGGVTASAKIAEFCTLGGVYLDLTQAGLTIRALDSVADADVTLADCLVAAYCRAVGDAETAGNSYLIKTPTGTTVRTLVVDNVLRPTSRT